MMRPTAFIEMIRDGEMPSDENWQSFMTGVVSGDVSDPQIAAFAMAVLLNGVGAEALPALTLAMRDTGDVLTWDIAGPVIDKHSTGGVGDPVSLVLAPALAACGAYVPMISGRGLGYTGGTLDKLEAIAGFRSDLSVVAMQAQVADIGCAIVGQTADLAPADKRIYAVRDVTATVPSDDLITASILSKKLAAGLQGLVLDIKCGRGAFMQDIDKARILARKLVDTANAAGCRTGALITAMDAPLARAAGNALEVRTVLDLMCDPDAEPRLRAVTAQLGGMLLAAHGLADDVASGAAMISATFTDGRAAERFLAMINAQGADVKNVDALRKALPTAPVILEVHAHHAGVFNGFDARAIGEVVIDLGGGRRQIDDRIDHAVGVAEMAAPEENIAKGDVIARVHGRDETTVKDAVACIERAILSDVNTALIIEGIG